MCFAWMGRVCTRLLRLFEAARQVDGDRSAAAEHGVDRRRSLRLASEAIDLGEPQSGAFARILGGEERLEHFGKLLWRDPLSGIFDRQGNEVAAQPLHRRTLAK